MIFAGDRYRWAAPLLLAAVMALVFAPRPAAAHGGHADEPDAAARAGDRATPVPGHAALQPVSAAWSPSCPSGHGSGCCCHVPVACTGGNQNPVVNVGGWARLVPPPARQDGPSPVESLPPSQFALSPALPRAPPFLS